METATLEQFAALAKEVLKANPDYKKRLETMLAGAYEEIFIDRLTALTGMRFPHLTSEHFYFRPNLSATPEGEAARFKAYISSLGFTWENYKLANEFEFTMYNSGFYVSPLAEIRFSKLYSHLVMHMMHYVVTGKVLSQSEKSAFGYEHPQIREESFACTIGGVNFKRFKNGKFTINGLTAEMEERLTGLIALHSLWKKVDREEKDHARSC